MASLQPSLYSIALALCVFSTGILSKREARTGRPAAFLIAYLAIESLGFALELLVAHPATPLKALWLGLLMASSLLTAPCLWLAVREAVSGERIRLADLTAGHGWVIALGTVFVLPLIGSAHLGTGWDSGYGANPPWYFPFIHAGMFGCVSLFAVQVPVYLRRAQRLLSAPTSADPTTSLGQRAWLHLPLIAVGTTWVLGMLRTVQCATHAPSAFVGLFALIDVSATVGALYVILRREFAESPATPTELETEPEIEIEAGPPPEPAPVPATKYAKSVLDAALSARVRTKINRAFAEHQVHRDSLLNLRSLSQAIGEKPHYVSQVINQDLGVSFYDLVNRHRIEDAQRQLRTAPAVSVLEIALAVGFNAKSTFNTAFRRHTGQTPSDYRATRPDR